MLIILIGVSPPTAASDPAQTNITMSLLLLFALKYLNHSFGTLPPPKKKKEKKVIAPFQKHRTLQKAADLFT